ncbi:nitrogenase component 1 [Bacillota bacterium LX-D]|nr:nitrogenase component 1 [Bacillota bacterium LX-D]
MAIDLRSAEVPIREASLGAITGYAGTAADLQEAVEKGNLAEKDRAFSQCVTCSSVTAICQLAMIQDAAVVNHAPLGCAGDFTNFNFINRSGQLKRGMRVENAHLISSNLREEDTIYGGALKLAQAVKEAKQRFNPKAVFITTSCASGIIGDDIQGVVDAIESDIQVPAVFSLLQEQFTVTVLFAF